MRILLRHFNILFLFVVSCEIFAQQGSMPDKKLPETREVYKIIENGKKTPIYRNEKKEFMKKYYSFVPGTKVEHIIKNGSEEVYSVRYEISDLGGRKVYNTPQATDETIDVLVVGGSNTFGQWVSQDNHLGQLLQDKLNSQFPGKYRVFNISTPGGSIRDTLFTLEAYEYEKIFKSRKLILIYNFFSFHINRDNCLPPSVYWSKGERVWYQRDGESVSFKGKCKNKFSVKVAQFLFKIFTKFPFLKKLQMKSSISHSDIVSTEDIKKSLLIFDKVINTLATMDRKVEGRILQSPFENLPEGDLKRNMTKSKYFMEVSKKEDFMKPENYFEYDKHTNEKGYQILSLELLSIINLLGVNLH